MGGRFGVVVFLVALVTACHLADSPEPPRCDAGFHPEMGRCVESVEKEIVAHIKPGCVLEPEPFVVKVNVDFQFRNDDTEAHTVTGIGGKLSIDLPAGGLSQYLQITKTGSFPYGVSGCANGGTITVE